MNSFTKQSMILILLLAAAAAAIFWFAWPAYARVGALKEEIAALSDKNQEIAGLGEKIKNLSASQGAADLDKISFALPAGRDEAGLLIQFDDLAAANGLLLSGISFSSEVKQARESADVPSPEDQGSPMGDQNATISENAPSLPYKTIGIKLSLSGKIDAFRNFMRAAENNLRLLDVKNISFDAVSSGEVSGGETSSAEASAAEGGGEQKEESVSFSVEMETYYK